MSLQNYDITVPVGKTFKVSSQGKYVYYYQGTTPNITAGTALVTSGNQQIKLTASNGGASILMMPGQAFRLSDDDKAPTEWVVSNVAGLEQITGTLLAGDGEFIDSNTSNTIKIDGTFANNVTVTNTTANRVPVTLDTTQTLNLTGNIVAYTNAYVSSAASVANTAIAILAAGTNVNGAVLNKFDLISSPGGATNFTILAKATAPANITDGDVLFSGAIPVSLQQLALDISKNGQIRVAAGKGIWYISTLADGCILRDALVTVL